MNPSESESNLIPEPKPYPSYYDEPIHNLSWSGEHIIYTTQNHINRWSYLNESDSGKKQRIAGSAATSDWLADGSQVASVFNQRQIAVQPLKKYRYVNFWNVPNERIDLLSWSPRGHFIATVCFNTELNIYSINTRRPIDTTRPIESTYGISHVIWKQDETGIAVGTRDNVIQIIDLVSRGKRRFNIPVSSSVQQLCYGKDGNTLYSALADNSIYVWSLQEKSAILRTKLHGPSNKITAMSISPLYDLLAARSLDGYVYIWSLRTHKLVDTIPTYYPESRAMAFHPTEPRLALSLRRYGQQQQSIGGYLIPADIHTSEPKVNVVAYRNAKVLIIGDKNVGKTRLHKRLFEAGTYAQEERYSSVVPIDHSVEHVKAQEGALQQLWLWDLMTVTNYRIISELELQNVSLVLLAFDGTSDDYEDRIFYWTRLVKQIKNTLTHTIVVETRVDRQLSNIIPPMDKNLIEKVKGRDFIKTSAEVNLGIKELHKILYEAIEWDQLPTEVFNTLFEKARDFILDYPASSGVKLTTIPKLYLDFKATLTDVWAKDAFVFAQFKSCLTFLEIQGRIRQFRHNGYILLEPMYVNYYVNELVRLASSRENSDHESIGYLQVSRIMPQNLKLDPACRLDADDEIKILPTIISDLTDFDVAFLNDNDQELVFPHLVAKNLTQPFLDIGAEISKFEFEGEPEKIYAKIVTRLTHVFELEGLGIRKAKFKTPEDEIFAISYDNQEYSGTIRVHKGENLHVRTRHLVEAYIEHFLDKYARAITQNQVVTCPHCKKYTLSQEQLAKITTRKVECGNCHEDIEVIQYSEEMREVAQHRVSQLEAEIAKKKDIQDIASLLHYKEQYHIHDAHLMYQAIDKDEVAQFNQQLRETYGVRSILEEPMTVLHYVHEKVSHNESIVLFFGKKGLGNWEISDIVEIAQHFCSVSNPLIIVLLSNVNLPLQDLMPVYSNIELVYEINKESISDTVRSLARLITRHNYIDPS